MKRIFLPNMRSLEDEMTHTSGRWFILFCLLCGAFSSASRAADPIPVHRPDRGMTAELAEGFVLNDEIVDIATQEPADLLLALSKSRLRILSLPKLDERASVKVRGQGLACGFVRESAADRILFYVVSAFGRDINTYFYEFARGKIKRAGYDSSSFFRSMDGVLLRQDVGRGGPFKNDISVCVLKKGRAKEASRLPLPQHTRLYAFARGAFWPNGGLGVARIEGDDRRLVLYRPDGEGWEAVWEADGAFGGSLLLVAGVDREMFEKRPGEELSRGPVPVNLDDDPELELLALSNIPAPIQQQILGRRYDRSQVTAFDVKGRRAVVLWETDRLKGTIPNVAMWRNRWVLPLVEPAGKKTRLYMNPLRPVPEG